MQDATLHAMAALVKENKTLAQVLVQPVPHKRKQLSCIFMIYIFEILIFVSSAVGARDGRRPLEESEA